MVELPVNESFSESKPGVLDIVEAGSFRFGDEFPFIFRTTRLGTFRDITACVAFTLLTFPFRATPDFLASTFLTFPLRFSFSSVGLIALASSDFRSVSERRLDFAEADFRALSRVLLSAACNFSSFSFFFLTRALSALPGRLGFASDMTVDFATELYFKGRSATFDSAWLGGPCLISVSGSRILSLVCIASRSLRRWAKNFC